MRRLSKTLLFFAGGFFLFTAGAMAAQQTRHGLFPEEIISMKDLRKMQTYRKSFLLLDARGKSTYSEAHIAGAKLPLSPEYYRQEELFRTGILQKAPDRDRDLAASMNPVPKNKPIVTYCNDDCQASSVLLLQLKHMGFTDVRAMDDGFQSWQKKGYPVEASAG